MLILSTYTPDLIALDFHVTIYICMYDRLNSSSDISARQSSRYKYTNNSGTQLAYLVLGDQIGRIFFHWAIVYFGQGFFENCRIIPQFGQLFSSV
jgi:hypothetical protein